MKNTKTNLDKLNFEELYKILNNEGDYNELNVQPKKNIILKYDYQVNY
jgi:hypothetical protein